MQITEQSNKNVIDAIKKLKKVKPDVIYFADT